MISSKYLKPTEVAQKTRGTQIAVQSSPVQSYCRTHVSGSVLCFALQPRTCELLHPDCLTTDPQVGHNNIKQPNYIVNMIISIWREIIVNTIHFVNILVVGKHINSIFEDVSKSITSKGFQFYSYFTMLIKESLILVSKITTVPTLLTLVQSLSGSWMALDCKVAQDCPSFLHGSL